MFPWTCASMFLRGLVRDASPGSGKPIVLPEKLEVPNESTKDQNGSAIHQQLTRRISSSERKP